jgi:hypothetical protein
MQKRNGISDAPKTMGHYDWQYHQELMKFQGVPQKIQNNVSEGKMG